MVLISRSVFSFITWLVLLIFESRAEITSVTVTSDPPVIGVEKANLEVSFVSS